MKTCKIILIICMVFFPVSGCSDPQQVTVTPPNSKQPITLPACTPLVVYTQRSLNVTGVEIPVSKTPIKIGDVTWKPDVIMQASEIVQILDNNRMTICSYLPALASSGTAAQFHDELKQYMDEAGRICQLALLIKLNNPEAVQKWIEAYAKRGIAIVEDKKAKKAMGMTSEAQRYSSIKTYQRVFDITDFVKR